MSAITTHVLDISRGRPAAGVPVSLYVEVGSDWKLFGKGTTDADGRISDLVPNEDAPIAGVYRLVFDTGTYFSSQKADSFYPQVTIVFKIDDPLQHYHVPLLLSPFGYSTYRGS